MKQLRQQIVRKAGVGREQRVDGMSGETSQIVEETVSSPVDTIEAMRTADLYDGRGDFAPLKMESSLHDLIVRSFSRALRGVYEREEYSGKRP